jgi:hypothetical protein
LIPFLKAIPMKDPWDDQLVKIDLNKEKGLLAPDRLLARLCNYQICRRVPLYAAPLSLASICLFQLFVRPHLEPGYFGVDPHSLGDFLTTVGVGGVLGALNASFHTHKQVKQGLKVTNRDSSKTTSLHFAAGALLAVATFLAVQLTAPAKTPEAPTPAGHVEVQAAPALAPGLK